MRRLVGGVVVAVVLVGAACSDDGGGSASSVTTDTGDLDAFCASVQAYLDGADFSDETTRAAYAGFLEVAPRQIRGAVRKIVAAQSGESIPAEDLTRANDKFTAYVEHPDGCGVAISSG